MIAPRWLSRVLRPDVLDVDAGLAGLRLSGIKEIERDLAMSVAAGKMAGAVLLISRGGTAASYRAFGWQDREGAIAMRTNSIFRVLSMTKSVTCAALLALVDDGKLSPDDPVEQYLPDFSRIRFADGRKPMASPRVWQLMAHSAGLVDAFPPEFAKTDFTLSDIVGFLGRSPLGYEPGEGWAYSNGGLAAVGSLIEKLSGVSYAKFVRTRIFQPVRMRSSYFQVPVEERGRLTAIYRIAESGISRETEDPINSRPGYVSPENGLHTTAADLWRFYEMIRQGGLSNGRRVLSEKSARSMIAVQTADRNAGFLPGMGYGYGFSLVTTPNGIFQNLSVGTFGHGSYYQTHGWVDPLKEITGMLFCQNRADSVVVTEEVARFVTKLGTLT